MGRKMFLKCMKQFTLYIYLKIQLPVSPEFEVYFQEDLVKEVLGLLITDALIIQKAYM